MPRVSAYNRARAKYLRFGPDLAPPEPKFLLTVTCVHGKVTAMIDWCVVELAGDWHWGVVTPSSPMQTGEYRFEFTAEKDAVAFCLRWLT